MAAIGLLDHGGEKLVGYETRHALAERRGVVDRVRPEELDRYPLPREILVAERRVELPQKRVVPRA
jgi:hypothetical protein